MKKFLATAAVLSFGAAAFAQSAALVQNNLAGVVAGPDAALLTSGAVDSFDIVATTTTDWTVTDIEVDVTAFGQGNGVSIWHASDETNFLGNGNLDVPLSPDLGTNSKEFDTFASGWNVGGFFVNPSIANGSYTSSATEISGFAIDGVTRIPLSIFNTAPGNIGSSTTWRLSFDNGGLPLTTTPDGDVAVTIRGVIKQQDNSTGTAFSYDLYQVPEPSALALLGLGGLVGLVRRR